MKRRFDAAISEARLPDSVRFEEMTDPLSLTAHLLRDSEDMGVVTLTLDKSPRSRPRTGRATSCPLILGSRWDWSSSPSAEKTRHLSLH